MNSLFRCLAGIAASAGLTLLSLPSSAQEPYPSKPVRIIVDQSVGGPIDQLARAVAPFMEKHVGNNASFVIVNQTGASGIIGRTAAAKARADGYTTHLFTYPAIITALFGQSSKPYSMENFEFLGSITAEPSGIFVKADSPFKTLDDFVKAGKANPGAVTVAGAGLGGAGHLLLRLFQQVAGLDYNYIPNQGAAEAVTQVLGGHVQAGVTTISGALPLVKSGQARFIAIASKERSESIPSTPTFIESGYDMTWAPIRGLAAPAGLPPEIRAKLSTALKKTMEDPAFLEVAKKSGFELTYMTGEEFTATAQKQEKLLNEMWAKSPWQ
jgi:tripartite-type tricarboxylate transporter receptor subunit TctC